MRRGIDQRPAASAALEPRASTWRQRQAARGKITDAWAPAARRTSARSSIAISRGGGACSAASTTSVCAPQLGEGGDEALDASGRRRRRGGCSPAARSASLTPARTSGAGRRPGRAAARCMQARPSGSSRRPAAASRAPAARRANTRLTSAPSTRQAASPAARAARAAPVRATTGDASLPARAGHWPRRAPCSLWRISASSAGPSFTASSIFDSTDAAAGGGAVRHHHVVDRLALRRGVDDQQLVDRAVRHHVQQLARARVALRHAGGVDQHHLLAGQQVEQVLERGAVVGGVHRHAEDAAVGAQLLVRGDAVGVERDQAQGARRRAGSANAAAIFAALVVLPTPVEPISA